MNTFQIYTEGKDDKKFVEVYLNHIGKGGIQFKIIDAEGWTNLHKVATRFQQISALGGKNLIIFDADNNFVSRRAEILQKIADLKLQTELFLFPNNQDSGNFDTLLMAISNPSHRQIYNCFDSYSQCLNAANSSYKRPTLKDKNYAYFQALGADPRADKRDYTILDHWDLNHQLLSELKIFLEAHII